MAQPKILTIRETEAELHLSGPRIHQLLKDGHLGGPDLPPGRKRHSPGAPRVYAASVRAYLEDREGERPPPRKAPKRTRDAGPIPEPGSARDAAAARTAAQEMKIKLDTAREEVAAERKRNEELLEVIDKLVGILRGSQKSADKLDDVADGYSEALTQLLTPDTPADG
jgi:hypothetical protein